ncbi:M1 family aminopeptidase [Flavobacterium enshiense]|uniref:M61 family metallopeptidase n=1 Tax=Flavobacterium enshiense TaxID=1341165 RepID=UPI00345CEA0A
MKNVFFLLFGLLISINANSQNNILQYQLDFTKQHQNLLHIKSNLDLTQAKNRFFMITHGSEKNPEGEAKFIKNLTVKNTKGQKQEIKYLGEGTWEVQSKTSGIFNVDYDIALEHNTENWDHCGGVDEVAYKTPEGLFFTGYSLFMAPDVASLGDFKNVTVAFTLPKNWKASTPWIKTPKRNHFIVNDDLRFLLNNCIFVGTHHEKEIKIGDFELLFALGKTMQPSEKDFIELMQPIIESTTKVFKGSPKKKYLIVVNENNVMTDGGAFRNSFSQIIKGKVNKNSRTNWGHIMAHETIHLWNGHTLTPKEQEEWFKEGFTDYLTNILLTRNKIIDEATFYKRFENVITKYNIARDLMQNKTSIQQSGNNKDQNRYLVYGGGELVALGLDIEIRKATNNQKNLDDLFAMMYEEFGKTNIRYELKDIIVISNKVSGKNLQWFFDDYVTGIKRIPVVEYLAEMGLQLDGYLEDVYITPTENPSYQQLQFKKGILGI